MAATAVKQVNVAELSVDPAHDFLSAAHDNHNAKFKKTPFIESTVRERHDEKNFTLSETWC